MPCAGSWRPRDASAYPQASGEDKCTRAMMEGSTECPGPTEKQMATKSNGTEMASQKPFVWNASVRDGQKDEELIQGLSKNDRGRREPGEIIMEASGWVSLS